MAGFTKLFNTIITSSVWNEDNETRIVWITMLALSDKDGIVNASMSGLAVMARLPVETCKKAIVKLSNPDLDSRTPENEGRRIEKVDGGWRIINYVKYRNLGRKDERREYLRLVQQQHRSKEKSNKKERVINTYTEAEADTSTPVNTCQQMSTPVNKYSIDNVKDACIMNCIPESNAQSYYDQYNSQDWKKANGQPITNLQSHMAKRWNKAKQCWDFDERKQQQEKPETIHEQAERLRKAGEL